jgi:hypothetical protein
MELEKFSFLSEFTVLRIYYLEALFETTMLIGYKKFRNYLITPRDATGRTTYIFYNDLCIKRLEQLQ